MKCRKYRVTVCGHFGGNKMFYDGQTIKTINVSSALESIYGSENIYLIDTFGGPMKLLRCFYQLLKKIPVSDNIIILPAQNSVKIIPLFLTIYNILLKKSIHYIVIGGWLPEITKKNKALSFILKTIDNIYVETTTMKNNLIKQGFKNIVLMRNFKNLRINSLEDLEFCNEGPFRICTFSRVMEQKGIEDIINAVKYVNKQKGKVVYKLDIYGHIIDDYKSEFNKLLNCSSNNVTYKGVVSPDESAQILKNYFALIFPTKFYTEGIPGTIIDAYAAGIPVISARWESFSDLIDEGNTGIGYEMNNVSELIKILHKYSDNPNSLNKMKEKCLKKAEMFLPNRALEPLIERL